MYYDADGDEVVLCRLQRFDSIPWQLFDMKEAHKGVYYQTEQIITAEEIIAQIQHIYSRREAVYEASPLVLPSLGMLHQFGARIRTRLECARRIARLDPSLFKMKLVDQETYLRVNALCSPRTWTAHRAR